MSQGHVKHSTWAVRFGGGVLASVTFPILICCCGLLTLITALCLREWLSVLSLQIYKKQFLCFDPNKVLDKGRIHKCSWVEMLIGLKIKHSNKGCIAAVKHFLPKRWKNVCLKASVKFLHDFLLQDQVCLLHYAQPLVIHRLVADPWHASSTHQGRRLIYFLPERSQSRWSVPSGSLHPSPALESSHPHWEQLLRWRIRT